MKALTREQVRAVDRRALERYGIPTLLLMENAGAGLARAVLAHLAERGLARDAVVAIVCGKGGNGGDGLVLARHLALAGHAPRILLACAREDVDRASDAGVNLSIVERMGLSLEVVRDGPALARLLATSRAALVADALLGTGLAQEVREPLAGMIDAMNGSSLPVVAVDLPSGLDADTGRPLGRSVRATFTVTFAAPKVGFAGAEDLTGPVTVVGIGCPVEA